MRKRLRKKSELKRIEAAKKLFKIRKSLAIAQLTIDTYKAYAKIINQPKGVREIMAHFLYETYRNQSLAIRSTMFMDDKTTKAYTVEGMIK
jgi:hypothetical protein